MNSGLHGPADVTEQARSDGHGQLVEGIKNRQDQCHDQPDDDDAVRDIHFFKHTYATTLICSVTFAFDSERSFK